MKRKIRYQAKTDLKLLRRINGISKEYVADKIGYTIRSLERMEKENAVTTERTAHQLCSLYDLVIGEKSRSFSIFLKATCPPPTTRHGIFSIFAKKGKYGIVILRILLLLLSPCRKSVNQAPTLD